MPMRMRLMPRPIIMLSTATALLLNHLVTLSPRLLGEDSHGLNYCLHVNGLTARWGELDLGRVVPIGVGQVARGDHHGEVVTRAVGGPSAIGLQRVVDDTGHRERAVAALRARRRVVHLQRRASG